MIKKIIFYLSICSCFIFCFLFGKYINTLAMGNFDNSIGTIPIQMDIDNYSKNLFDFNRFAKCGREYYTSCTIDYDNKNIISVNTSGTTYAYSIVTSDLTLVLEPNTDYTISFDYTGDLWRYSIFYTDWQVVAYTGEDLSYLTFNSGNYATLFLGIYPGLNIDSTTTISNIQLEKGTTKTAYYPPLKFGYNASLNYIINSSGSSTTVNYYFNDNTYTKTTSSVNGGYLIENYYIPFFIDEKGYISLPNINFGISSISNSSSSITYSLQLELTPVFNAYYKGEYTTNIYTKLNYMSNDLFFSGIIFGGCKSNSCLNNINAGNLSLTNPKTLAVTEQNDTGNISTTNISTYYNDDIKNRNYFEYNNYLNVGFRLGDLAETYSFMNGRNYTFGISSLSSRMVDNQTTTTPLPNNPNTIDKYNTCSAWYDIPCQLGNAVTYVIYEAPIISPVLTFIVSFITMFSSLVSFVELFRSFGIVFGCFILYMFIELLHKYSK